MSINLARRPTSAIPRTIATVIFLVVSTIDPNATFAIPVGAGALVWSDEFTGATLDATKWTTRLGPGRDDIYTTQAVSVDSGALTIKTYTENGTHYNGWIDTQQTFQPTYGYFESRIQFNTTHGVWSAFWLQTPLWSNPVFGNPAVSGTEIDIIEHRSVNGSGADYRGRIHMANHWDGYGSQHQSRSFTPNMSSSGMGNGSWHTYGLLWEPDKYTFYFDGQEVWTHTAAISQRPEFMILSSEAEDDSWAGDIPSGGYGSLASTVTNMQVDYVRVYALMAEPQLPGDFDNDSDVDGADFVVWQTNFPKATGGTPTTGDADNDGDVDGADFVIWQTNFPYTPSLATSTVPEPAALLLALLSVPALAYMARCSRKSPPPSVLPFLRVFRPRRSPAK